MTIQDLHEALVQSHGNVDPTLASVLKRGERRRRRRHLLASAAIVTVAVSALGIGITNLKSGSQTRVTTAAGAGRPAASTRPTAGAPLRAASKVRLQASDWQTSSRNGTRSRAADARYTIASLSGRVLNQGTIDRSGRVVVTVRAASATISVDQCNLEAMVVRLTPAETSTIEFPCGGGEHDLPPQSIPKTTENPTDNELRAANQEAVSCIEAAGLTVSNSHLTVDASGHVSRGIQIGLADSGLTFDESGAVQAECEKRYLSLMFARGDWLMDHGR